MVPYLSYKFHMICFRRTYIIEQKPNVGWKGIHVQTWVKLMTLTHNSGGIQNVHKIMQHLCDQHFIHNLLDITLQVLVFYMGKHSVQDDHPVKKTTYKSYLINSILHL